MRSSHDGRSDDRLRRLDRFWRNHGRCRVGHGLDPYELKSLAPAVASSTTAARGTRTSGPFSMLCLEITRRNRIQHREDDYGMDKKRGGDTLPPPLSLARNTDRRPILIGRYDPSLGDMPITLTPAPRDTSIAKITSSYFTFGSPLTKMIFSGRSL